MRFRIHSVMLTSALFAALPAVAAAQSTSQLAPTFVSGPSSSNSDVTFSVPLNFTKLSSDIATIAVFCYIDSVAISPPRPGGPNRAEKQEEYQVSGGKLVMTPATVVVPISILVDPVGKQATYTCNVTGYSTALKKWDKFDPSQTTPAFKLSPASPQSISGTFTW